MRALHVTLRRTAPFSRAIVAAAVALSLALGVASCSLHKAPPRSEISAKAMPAPATIPPGWTPTSPTGEDVSNDWVKTFGDPGLESVVNEAIAHNTDLRQAAATVEIARQGALLVGAKLKPQVGLNAGGSLTRDKDQDETFRSNEIYVQVAWEVDIWGRLRSERAAAVAQYQATALDYAFARQSLAATTAQTWYLAIETRQLIGLAQQDVDIHTRLLDLAKVKYSAGKVSALDVAEATAALNNSQAKLVQTQGLYNEVRRSLEVLVGRFPSAELDVAQDYAQLPPPIKAGLPASLLERRPDILAAESQVIGAFRSLESARLALLPTIVLTAEGGRLSDGILNLLKLNPYLIAASAGLFQPIFNGGALRTKIRIETAKQEKAIANYGSVALGAFRDVEVALNNEQVLADQIQYEQQALVSRVEAVRIATLRYQAGKISLLPVLQLQSEQLLTQASIIKLQDAQLANRVKLHLALGGGFDSEPAATMQPPPPTPTK
ncbi:MAG TPA: efflux transporter outer membrane subunit [Blastocatellia bacterium]|nr:efflux transporter outer membrane subunit [Blastocatellia bacterium]